MSMEYFGFSITGIEHTKAVMMLGGENRSVKENHIKGNQQLRGSLFLRSCSVQKVE